MNIKQVLSDVGVNPFALDLLCESFLRAPLASELHKRGEALRFFFPVRRSDIPAFVGVQVFLDPMREADLSLGRFSFEPRLSNAAADALAERRRQISSEGWTPEHDDKEHDTGELASAGSAYALAAADQLYPLSQGDAAFDGSNPPPMWPPGWEFKPAEPRRMLVKAIALLLAEVERFDRAAAAAKGGAV